MVFNFFLLLTSLWSETLLLICTLKMEFFCEEETLYHSEFAGGKAFWKQLATCHSHVNVPLLTPSTL